MPTSDVLALLASSASLLSYVVYNMAAMNGRELNLATITLWLGMSAISAFTFLSATGDMAKAAVPLANMIANAVTLLVAIRLGGSFRKFSTWEKRMILLGSLAIICWKLVNPMLGNYVVILALAISVMPIYRKVIGNPLSEHWLPWALWTLAFGLQGVIVALKFDGHYGQFAQPVVYAALHGGIGILALRK